MFTLRTEMRASSGVRAPLTHGVSGISALKNTQNHADARVTVERYQGEQREAKDERGEEGNEETEGREKEE